MLGNKVRGTVPVLQPGAEVQLDVGNKDGGNQDEPCHDVDAEKNGSHRPMIVDAVQTDHNEDCCRNRRKEDEVENRLNDIASRAFQRGGQFINDLLHGQPAPGCKGPPRQKSQ